MLRHLPHQPFDREPAFRALECNVFVGPHGATTRATYTVPAGRWLLLLLGFMRINRVASGSGAPALRLIYAGSGVPALEVLVPPAAPAGGIYAWQGAVGLYLPGGATLALVTSDESAGGSAAYTAQFGMLEFDA